MVFEGERGKGGVRGRSLGRRALRDGAHRDPCVEPVAVGLICRVGRPENTNGEGTSGCRPGGF